MLHSKTARLVAAARDELSRVDTPSPDLTRQDLVKTIARLTYTLSTLASHAERLQQHAERLRDENDRLRDELHTGD